RTAGFIASLLYCPYMNHNALKNQRCIESNIRLRALGVIEFREQGLERRGFVAAERAENLALGLLPDVRAFHVRVSSHLGEDGKPRSAVARIGRSHHKPIRLQAI